MTSKQLLDLAPEQLAKRQSEIAHSPSRAIPQLVSLAIALDRDIANLETILASYKSRLVKEARADCQVQEMPPLGTTWSYNAEHAGSAHVNFPQDSLIKGGFTQFQGSYVRYQAEEMIILPNLQALAGNHFQTVFQTYWRPAKAFRDLVNRVVGPANGPKLIAACEEPSSPRVTFKTKS